MVQHNKEQKQTEGLNKKVLTREEETDGELKTAEINHRGSKIRNKTQKTTAFKIRHSKKTHKIKTDLTTRYKGTHGRQDKVKL